MLPDGREDETYNSFASKEMNSSSSFALGTSSERMKHPYLFRLCGTEHNVIYTEHNVICYETFIGSMGVRGAVGAPLAVLEKKVLKF